MPTFAIKPESFEKEGNIIGDLSAGVVVDLPTQIRAAMLGPVVVGGNHVLESNRLGSHPGIDINESVGRRSEKGIGEALKLVIRPQRKPETTSRTVAGHNLDSESAVSDRVGHPQLSAEVILAVVHGIVLCIDLNLSDQEIIQLAGTRKIIRPLELKAMGVDRVRRRVIEIQKIGKSSQLVIFNALVGEVDEVAVTLPTLQF